MRGIVAGFAPAAKAPAPIQDGVSTLNSRTSSGTGSAARHDLRDETVGLPAGESAGENPRAVGNDRTDRGRDDHPVINDDRQRVADVLRGVVGENRPAVGRELEFDLRCAELVERLGSPCHERPGQYGLKHPVGIRNLRGRDPNRALAPARRAEIHARLHARHHVRIPADLHELQQAGAAQGIGDRLRVVAVDPTGRDAACTALARHLHPGQPDSQRLHARFQNDTRRRQVFRNRADSRSVVRAQDEGRPRAADGRRGAHEQRGHDQRQGKVKIASHRRSSLR